MRPDAIGVASGSLTGTGIVDAYEGHAAIVVIILEIDALIGSSSDGIGNQLTYIIVLAGGVGTIVAIGVVERNLGYDIEGRNEQATTLVNEILTGRTVSTSVSVVVILIEHVADQLLRCRLHELTVAELNHDDRNGIAAHAGECSVKRVLAIGAHTIDLKRSSRGDATDFAYRLHF